MELFDYKEAIADYTKAIEIKPNDADAYNDRGVAKKNLEDLKGAIADYTKAIEINPNDAKAYYNSGNAKENLGDYKGAKADYTKCKKIDPDYDPVLFHFETFGIYHIIDNKLLEEYPREYNNENKDNYFIALKLYLSAADDDDEDLEIDTLAYLKSKLKDENLIFTQIGPDHETHRIIGLPEILYTESENSYVSLLNEPINIKDGIKFLKNMKTINYSDLKIKAGNDVNNFKFVTFNQETEETDSNKIVIVKTYHENGQIKQETEIVNGKRKELLKFYYDNGQIKQETEIVNGKWHGLYKLYYDNGQIKEEIEIVNGERHGLCKIYCDNGQLKVALTFTNGIQNPGNIISYHHNGIKAREVTLTVGGKFNGEFYEWFENGNKKNQGHYIEGVCIIEKEWNENGTSTSK